MKIRYLHLQNYPPLNDLEISLPASSLLEDRNCSIKFIVGVNGSGKSNLQRAVYQIFLSLSKKEHPPFPAAIAYELESHKDITLVYCQKEKAAGWWLLPEIFPEYKETDWNFLMEDLLAGKKNANRILEDSNFPDVIPYLPKAVLAYSTGNTEHWERIIREEADPSDIESVLSNEEVNWEDIFRPVNWSREKEKNHLLKNGEDGKVRIGIIEETEKGIIEIKDNQYICKFLTPKYMKFGFLSSLLYHFIVEKSFADASSNYLDLIRQSGWELGISFSWKISLDLDRLKLNKQLDRVEKLFESANDVIKDPAPSEIRTLYFDLDNIKNENIENVFGKNDKPYEFLKRMIEFEELGVLEDVEIILKKKDLDGLILFSELSDGEQMFLCRMSLFHLLKGYDDALLILDEPETHFNDKWKREIVDMIDSALKDTASEVLISTHSSIVLTDVFHDEIVLLEKDGEGTKRIELVSPTFGAITSEILTKVFGQDEKKKKSEGNEKNFGKDNSVDRNDKITIGRRAYNYLKGQLNDRKWSYENIEELENIVNNIGIGYYQNRLSSILYKLKEEKNASSD